MFVVMMYLDGKPVLPLAKFGDEDIAQEWASEWESPIPEATCKVVEWGKDEA